MDRRPLQYIHIQSSLHRSLNIQHHEFAVFVSKIPPTVHTIDPESLGDASAVGHDSTSFLLEIPGFRMAATLSSMVTGLSVHTQNRPQISYPNHETRIPNQATPIPSHQKEVLQTFRQALPKRTFSQRGGLLQALLVFHPVPPCGNPTTCM